MKLKSAIMIVVMLASVLIVAGCTTTPGGPGTTTQVTNTQHGQTTAGQTPVPCSRATVQGSVLQSYLPAAQSGWVADEPFWYTMPTDEGCDYSWASQEYTKGSLTVTIMIFDTNYWGGIAFFSGWGYSYSSSSGYGKGVTVKGYPGYEAADYSSNDIIVMVDVGNGIWVWVMIDGESHSTTNMYAYANAINYAGLDGLA